MCVQSYMKVLWFFFFRVELFEPREVCALLYLMHDVLFCKQSRLGPILNASDFNGTIQKSSSCEM